MSRRKEKEKDGKKGVARESKEKKTGKEGRKDILLYRVMEKHPRLLWPVPDGENGMWLCLRLFSPELRVLSPFAHS